MKIRIDHKDLKKGAGTRQIISEVSGQEIKRAYVDAHNKEILSIKTDSKGLLVEIDSAFIIVEEQ